MPIYAYKCSACGHAEDVLQKMSDAPLTVCPSCGQATYVKQVTAAGFQLKGSGWYVTDFRGGNGAGSKNANDGHGSHNANSAADKSSAPEGGGASTEASAKPSTSSDSGARATPAASAPTASASSPPSPPAAST